MIYHMIFYYYATISCAIFSCFVFLATFHLQNVLMKVWHFKSDNVNSAPGNCVEECNLVYLIQNIDVEGGLNETKYSGSCFSVVFYRIWMYKHKTNVFSIGTATVAERTRKTCTAV